MSGTKDRLIDATAESIGRRGIAATSFTEVLAQAGAPRGVIYHHFPGGKAQLTEAAVTRTGSEVAQRFTELAADQATPERLLTAFLAHVRPIVQQSADGSGCAIAGVVTEADQDTPEALAGRHALHAWHYALVDGLTSVGMKPQRAADTAALLLATLQGAHVLCRAEGTIEPFDAASRALLRHLATD